MKFTFEPLFSDIIGEYLKSIHEEIQHLNQNLENLDANDSNKIIHKIKGSALTYGLEELNKMILELETLVNKENDPTKLKNKLLNIDQYLLEFIEYVKQR